MASRKTSSTLAVVLIGCFCVFAAWADIGPFNGTSQRSLLMLQPAMTGQPGGAAPAAEPPQPSITGLYTDQTTLAAETPIATVGSRDIFITGTHPILGVQSAATNGSIEVLLDGTPIETTPNSNDSVTINLESAQNQPRMARIEARVIVTDANGRKTLSKRSNPLFVGVETEGPQLRSVGVESPTEIRLTFAKNDLNPQTAGEEKHYRIINITGEFPAEVTATTTAPVQAPIESADVHGKVVILKLNSKLITDGDYEVEVTSSVTDKLGNRAGQVSVSDGKTDWDRQSRRFSVFGERKTGRHIEFPDFVQRQKLPPGSVFNPGDNVQTRVCRLYYFRDAHYVAQLLNRNIRQYNKAGVDRADRIARLARDDAESATDSRRSLERAAVSTAQKTREAQKELDSAETELADIQRRSGGANKIANDIKDTEAAITKLTSDITTQETAVSAAATAAQTAQGALNTAQATQLTATATTTPDKATADTNVAMAEATLNTANAAVTAEQNKLNQLNQSKRDKQSQLAQLQDDSETLAKAEQKIGDLETEHENRKAEEEAANEKAIAADAKEQRAVEHQFRADVAAAKENPDTYVPGDVDSIDAVTQVSISVIGEGLIQLRGPKRGIDKIRTMINQIDSPVGQVKVGIFTVQINGEQADRMEKVATEVEGHIDLSRFLTNYSLALMRRAVQETAAQIIARENTGPRQHLQSERDSRYMYAFFGRDFIDELFEMDSEFVRTENKLLSLHAMDTVSQSQTMFILALAKNTIREAILDRFMQLVQTELPDAEWDFRQASDLKTKNMRKVEKMQKYSCFLPAWMNKPSLVHENAIKRYTFRNFRSFFRADVYTDDTMTPLQREFIRLAQIFKSTMLSEMELKQRIVERALIQQYAGDEEAKLNDTIAQHEAVDKQLKQAVLNRQEAAAEVLSTVNEQLSGPLNEKLQLVMGLDKFFEQQGLTEIVRLVGPEGFYSERLHDGTGFKVSPLNRLEIELTVDGDPITRIAPQNAAGNADAVELLKETGEPERDLDYWDLQLSGNSAGEELARQRWIAAFSAIEKMITDLDRELSTIRFSEDRRELFASEKRFLKYLGETRKAHPTTYQFKLGNLTKAIKLLYNFRQMASVIESEAAGLSRQVARVNEVVNNPNSNSANIRSELIKLQKLVFPQVKGDLAIRAEKAFVTIGRSLQKLKAIEQEVSRVQQIERISRVQLDQKKMLDYLIDEKKEKYIELVEGTRSHIAQMDTYLKRLAIAMEDDFKVQFYDRAFRGVREASLSYDVGLGQVERTTILTNNRALAIVKPQATMEFDLPKRAPVIVEAMKGAKGLMQEYGNLMQDPAFVGLTGMMSGAPAVGGAGTGGAPSVKAVVPGQESSSGTDVMSASAPPQGPANAPGAAIESLIPDPSVYKFETGTGFEIRPVIQPDGHSVIYDFNYMYTSNVREPVRADEKHLGRIKRHFIDTEVQTSSFELREISRYLVALKASRTSKGVPLFEDLPGVGALFRPAPSAESSLQQNIILGHTTVYPTLFDLMGLRWSRHVADLDHMDLRDTEHVIRGRNQVINDFVFDTTSEEVDSFLDIKDKHPEHYRPDLYHRQVIPSPNHPSGYTYTDEDGKEINDPTGRNFHRKDHRPREMRFEPPFDSLRRGPIDDYGTGRESLPPRSTPLEQIPPAPVPSVSQISAERMSGDSSRIQLSTYQQPSRSRSVQSEARQAKSTPVPARAAPRPVPEPRKRSLVDRILRR